MSKQPPLEITCSQYFMQWLENRHVSIALTTYHTNRLFLIGLKEQQRLSVFERMFEHAMGLCVAPDRLYMSSKYQVWEMHNALPHGATHDGFDKLYVPRVAHTTGNIDVHDMALDQDGKLVFVNTLYSCLATLSENYNFTPIWKPSFISRLAPEDRCHLNGLAMKDGRPAYVTAVSKSDVTAGWRERRQDGGVVIDVQSNEIILDGLSMPHSPRYYRDRLWVLNSGTGEFGFVDENSGNFETVAFCPGYMRGLAFIDNYAIIGLSKPRHEKVFNGLPLQDALQAKDAEAQCGFMIINIETGNVEHWLQFEGVVVELYDIQVLQGVRRPTALGFKSDEIHRFISFEHDNQLTFSPLSVIETQR
jgi:uncharacterized protein (TIGR03032 family)